MKRAIIQEAAMKLNWNLVYHEPSRRFMAENIVKLNESVVKQWPHLDELSFKDRKLVISMAELVVAMQKKLQWAKEERKARETRDWLFWLYSKHNSIQELLVVDFYKPAENRRKQNSIVFREGLPRIHSQEKPFKLYRRKLKLRGYRLIDQGSMVEKYLKNYTTKHILTGKKTKLKYQTSKKTFHPSLIYVKRVQ